MTLKQKIQKLSKKYHKEIVKYREHLHMYPELSFEENKTAAFIVDKLKKFNIPFKKGIAKTGIVGILKGTKKEKQKNNRVFALRADMDALPIQETNKIPYKSKNKGVMHACGHDVHTASLLGTAKILSELRNEFSGTVKFIFQPSEEKLPGGASVMIKEGVLRNPEVDAIIGQHVFPELAAGKVGFRPGMYMASCDEIYITIKGDGGHAALVDNTSNTLIIAAQTLLELRFLINRFKRRQKAPTILSFGKIIGNGATNVVPEEVYMEGTFRTMDEKWRKKALDMIYDKVHEITKDMGGSCEVKILRGYPFLNNNIALTKKIQKYAISYLGKKNVIDLDLRLTAEDFSYYSQVTNACFYRLGVANKSKGITSSVHTSTFDIDPKALETGIGLMSWVTINELQTGNK